MATSTSRLRYRYRTPPNHFRRSHPHYQIHQITSSGCGAISPPPAPHSRLLTAENGQSGKVMTLLLDRRQQDLEKMCSDSSVAFAFPLKVSRMGLWPLAHLKRNYNPSRIGYPMSKHLRAFIFRALFCTLNTSAHRRTWQHCARGTS
jgi:hypothetical protein